MEIPHCASCIILPVERTRITLRSISSKNTTPSIPSSPCFSKNVATCLLVKPKEVRNRKKSVHYQSPEPLYQSRHGTAVAWLWQLSEGGLIRSSYQVQVRRTQLQGMSGYGASTHLPLFHSHKAYSANMAFKTYLDNPSSRGRRDEGVPENPNRCKKSISPPIAWPLADTLRT